MFYLQTPQWRLPLCTKSFRPPFPTAFLPPLPQCPGKEVAKPLQAPVAGRISDVSESSQADSQDVLEYEQPIHELLLREQLARQPPGTCLNRQLQLNADPDRLAGRRRSELQAPPP